jgi:hypothetical protein
MHFVPDSKPGVPHPLSGWLPLLGIDRARFFRRLFIVRGRQLRNDVDYLVGHLELHHR